MKTITISLYRYEDLSESAKERALSDWREATGKLVFLTDDLREYIYEELTEKGFRVLGQSTSVKPTIKPYYSLSHCQGDGLMFEACVEDGNGNVYTISHKGHYHHERSTSISGIDAQGDQIDTTSFEEDVYIPICKRVARRGYDEIAYWDSEEALIEADRGEVYLSDGSLYTL